MKEADKETRDKIRKAAAEGRVDFPDNVRPDEFPSFKAGTEFVPRIRDVEMGKNFLRIDWSAKNFGFGSLIVYKKNGQVYLDTEAMGPESVQRIFKALTESATII